MGTYFPGTGTLGWVIWSGAGIPHSQVVPPGFCLPQREVGPPTFPPFCASLPLHASPPLQASSRSSASLSLLPIWINVASLNPWLLDFHTAQFLTSLGNICFVVYLYFFPIGVQRGKVCLPTPPS